jgi:hypothetical protein
MRLADEPEAGAILWKLFFAAALISKRPLYLSPEGNPEFPHPVPEGSGIDVQQLRRPAHPSTLPPARARACWICFAMAAHSGYG